MTDQEWKKLEGLAEVFAQQIRQRDEVAMEKLADVINENLRELTTAVAALARVMAKADAYRQKRC